MKSSESGMKAEAVGGASKPIPFAQFVQQPLKKYDGGEDVERKVPTVYKEIDGSQIVQFYGRIDWLSNFAQSPVHIDGIITLYFAFDYYMMNDVRIDLADGGTYWSSGA